MTPTTARDSMVRVPDAELGDVAMAAPVPRFSVTPGRIKHAGSRPKRYP